MSDNPSFWRVCSSCKKQIPFLTPYYECSVTTCSGKRTGFVFCTIQCWETHLPQARHRDAWAVEKKSPSLAQFKAEHSGDVTQTLGSSTTANAPKRIIVSSPSGVTNKSGPNLKTNAITSTMDNEVLVVVSKMKQYIKDKADMNTAGEVSDTLSDMIRRACDKAMEAARADGRKTVMSRDFL